MARTYRRDEYQGGELNPAWLTPRPSHVIGVEQHAGEVMPPTCPKCGALWIEASYWEARCLCGYRWYRTVGEMLPPTKLHPPRHETPDV